MLPARSALAALALGAGISAAVLGAGWPESRVRAAGAARAADAYGDPGARALAQLELIARRPPFHASRLPAPASAAAASQAEDAASAAAEPPPVMVGSLLMGGVRKAFFQVDGGAVLQTAAVGELVGKWRLASLSARSATFAAGEATETVALTGATGARPASPPAAPAAAPPAQPGANPSPAGAQVARAGPGTAARPAFAARVQQGARSAQEIVFGRPRSAPPRAGGGRGGGGRPAPQPPPDRNAAADLDAVIQSDDFRQRLRIPERSSGIQPRFVRNGRVQSTP